MIQVGKDALHRLIDELPDAELPAARRFLEFLRDRGSAAEPCPECGEMEHEPNAQTAQAMRDSESGAGVTTYQGTEELYRSLGI
jgi:hypothetical protein